MKAKTVQGLQGPIPKLMGIFSVRVEVAQTRYNEPFVDGGACVGDIIVAQDDRQTNRSAEEEVFKACEEGTSVSDRRR